MQKEKWYFKVEQRWGENGPYSAIIYCEGNKKILFGICPDKFTAERYAAGAAEMKREKG